MALRAGIVAGALVVAGAALAIWLVARAPARDLVVRAEFTDARGLVGGSDVRINGAPAGTVSGLRLTRQGTAMVTLRLDRGLPAVLHPRADATAAIRPVDLLGDNYVALDVGHAAAPLRGSISTSRTLNAPRLSDLLSVFHEPQRTGLQALLVELGRSLDQRGADLNVAALDLRPTLQAADAVMRELGSQNAGLRRVIADSEAVTAQAAAHNVDLARSIADLDGVVQTTAEHLPGLDSGLVELPATLRQLTTTATRLRATATAARPLARTLGQIAPGLATAARRLPSFLGAAASAAHQLHPTLRTAAGVLKRADPSLYALGSGLSRFPPISAPLATFASSAARAAPSIAEGFFVNFPDQGSEPGNQPFDPFANPLRDYWRGAAVLSCQAFGVPIAPGCLRDWLASHGPRGRSAPRRLTASRPPTPGAGAPMPNPAQGPGRLPALPSVPPVVSSVVRSAAQPASPPAHRLLSYLLGP